MLMNISTKFHACIRMCMIIVTISRDLFKTSTSQRLTELNFGAVFTSIKLPGVVTNVLMNWETGEEHSLASFCSNLSNDCMLF